MSDVTHRQPARAPDGRTPPTSVDRHILGRHVRQVALVLQNIDLPAQVVVIFLVLGESGLLGTAQDVLAAHHEELADVFPLLGGKVRLHLRDQLGHLLQDGGKAISDSMLKSKAIVQLATPAAKSSNGVQSPRLETRTARRNKSWRAVCVWDQQLGANLQVRQLGLDRDVFRNLEAKDEVLGRRVEKLCPILLGRELVERQVAAHRR